MDLRRFIFFIHRLDDANFARKISYPVVTVHDAFQGTVYASFFNSAVQFSLSKFKGLFTPVFHLVERINNKTYKRDKNP